MNTRHSRWLSSIALVMAACGEDVYIPPPFGGGTVGRTLHDSAIDPVGAADSATPPPEAADASIAPACAPITAEAEPARQRAFGASSAIVAARDVFDRFFVPQCGSCHANAINKLIVKGLPDLRTEMDDILDRLTTTDREKVMPSVGKKLLLSERMSPDPVLELDLMLRAWRDSGFKDSFVDPRMGAGAVATTASLKVDAPLGKSLTNMGTCVPAARIVGTQTAKMDELDAQFASFADFQSLPKKLSQTDLFTLESQALAEHGVISYAPAYTLWADDAKKMRYVRVPRGTSVAFSVATQSFDIPDNTRFYKTFTKAVIDQDGNTGYKKVETRLIVARHAVEVPGQEPEIKALFGTYIWNEEETEAVLLEDPLNNGQPFRDLVTWYVTDESRATTEIEKAISIGALEFGPDASDAEKRLLSKNILISAAVARHYAVPGSTRCVQCHQGGPDGSFVLAFSPLQIMRRPMGEGGVIEPALADELNQLERFISYGLITGITVDQIPKKLLPLEKSQGARSPRTEQELIAQGYMLGNCAHCHNPRGYATQTAPELLELLNFYPNADNGGIFEFPLERVSPRIKRKVRDDFGEQITLELPYITPSIYDNQRGAQPGFVENQALPAPWRSLIYRNVAAPFSYSSASESTIYPHMPLNTPGFDVRAPRIVAEWMISIPARPKSGVLVYEAEDTRVQPYQESKKGDPDYSASLLRAAVRLDTFRKSPQYLQEWLSTKDIVDPTVKYPVKPVPENATDNGAMPFRPHWVPMDLTEPPPPWMPRNPTWRDTLVNGKVAIPVDPAESEEMRQGKERDVKLLISVLQEKHLDDRFVEFARTKLPMWVWEQKPGCDFSQDKRVSSYPSADRQSWMTTKGDQEPVYEQSPGAAVFGQICVNCHGKRADSRGRQADSLVLMTGGGARVANFRPGLLGPEEEPGANMKRVFSTGTDTPRDWAARYMAWMALGGTSAVLPSAILDVVGNNAVFGKGVGRGAAAEPNMLSIAKSICSALLPESLTFHSHQGYFTKLDPEAEIFGALVNTAAKDGDPQNGDPELWRRICTYDNPIPVRAVDITFNSTSGRPSGTSVRGSGDEIPWLFSRDTYPANAPVMDHAGVLRRGLTAENQTPWCVIRMRDTGPDAALLDAYIQQHGLAACPEPLLANEPDVLTGLPTINEYRLTEEEVRKWTLRGAVNAGFAVFTYVDDLINKRVPTAVEYNRCEERAMSMMP